MKTTSNIHETKRWVLLEHLPFPYSKRLLLILFLYSLAFTLLLVGLRMFCHNLSAVPQHEVQKKSGSQKTVFFQNQKYLQNDPNIKKIQELPSSITGSDFRKQEYSLEQSTKNAENIQQNIADHIIRLHVIAHSDSAQDQSLKLKVRDEVLSQIQTSLIPSKTLTEAENILEDLIPAIQEIAQHKIQAEGYHYNAHVVLEQRYFPAKTYGDLTFPPGTYQALCIEIGEAVGKNWWCVLFPSLCFVDETTAEVPETSKEKLENSLSEEAYHSLSNQTSASPTPTPQPEFHSAIYDWIRKH